MSLEGTPERKGQVGCRRYEANSRGSFLSTSFRIYEDLANWDCIYDKDSKGATLFENFYESLIRDVFQRVSGKAWPYTQAKIGIFFHYFDKVILEYSHEYDSLLWKGETR